MPNELDLYRGAQRYESATGRAFWQDLIGRLRGKARGPAVVGPACALVAGAPGWPP